MPRNGLGTYFLPQAPFVAGTVISSAAVNSNFSDIATALTGSFARDGQSTMTGQFKALDGGLSTPGYSFGNETNTGFTRPGAGQMGAVIQGTQIATFSSTGIASNFTGTANLSGTFSGTFAGVMPSGIDVPSGDVNNLIIDGFYFVEAACTNQPLAGVQFYMMVQKFPLGSGYVQQTAWNLTPGGGGTVYTRNFLNSVWQTWRQIGKPPRGQLWGLTMSTAGASTTMTIAAGEATDSNNTVPELMILPSGISKTTAAWAVGNGNGGLDTGSIAASTWYHFYLVERIDTGVVDVVFSLNASSSLPSGYTAYRRIGSMKTNGASQWTSFKQYEDTFYLQTASTDTATQPGTTDTLFTLGVPTGIRVKPMCFFSQGISASATSGIRPRVPDLQPTITGVDPTTGNAIGLTTNVARSGFEMNMDLWTNTSAQINIIASIAQTIWNIQTYGWIDTRGRLS